MKTRYARRRDQRSRIWRKRRARQHAHWTSRNYLARCAPKGPSTPNVDTSLKAPLMMRIIAGVAAALSPKRAEAKTQHQRQQAR